VIGITLFFFAALFVFPPEPAQARETSYVDKTGEGPRFVHRFSWEPEEYASRYEVRMEKRETAGDWIQIMAEFTTADFIELSLSPGSYRYSVRAYDLMERPSGNPEWMYFEVLPALQPELYGFTPNSVTLDELVLADGKLVLTLNVRGKNLAQAAEFRLISETGELVFPLRYSPKASGENAVLVFGGEGLSPGNYSVGVVNPGGLSDSLGSLSIHPPRSGGEILREFFVSLGYGPLIPLYGALNELLEASLFPAGAYGRVSWLPLQMDAAAMGLETAFYGNYISTRYEDGLQSYDVTGRFLGFEAYALFQKFLNRSIAFNLRLGGGFFSVLGFEKKTPQTGGAGQKNVLFPAAGGGISLRWFFYRAFMELGAEYMHLFSVDDPSPGYLRPVLGAGISW
jgi:hypothetical protein